MCTKRVDWKKEEQVKNWRKQTKKKNFIAVQGGWKDGMQVFVIQHHVLNFYITNWLNFKKKDSQSSI